MNPRDQPSPSCCRNAHSLGGLKAEDFSALDKVAVGLICLDSEFAEPLRRIGERMGRRIAAEHPRRSPSIEAALCALIPACGLQNVVESRFERTSAEEANLRINGCSEALGWRIPNLGRPVCTFDEGLFEGFLRGSTGEQDVTVEETACLGRGDMSCEFTIRHQAISRDEWLGGAHAGH